MANQEPLGVPQPDDVEAVAVQKAAAPEAAAQPERDDGPGAVEAAAEQLGAEVDELAALAAQRDEFKALAQRIQADFENYKKRITKQQTEQRERAAEDLVVRLLPVLDAFDLALGHYVEGLEPVYRSLIDVLQEAGLERIEPIGAAFDPTEHDAVLHEEGDGEPQVIEVMRPGYRWKGRVLRPAMVKVKG